MTSIHPDILARLRSGGITESPPTLALVTALQTIPAGSMWTYGHWVEQAGAGGALAASKLRHRLYDEASDLLPLHRIMSTNDFYGCIDGPVPQGEHGRVFKIALREVEGSLDHLPPKKQRSALPSLSGLPASKIKAKDMLPDGTVPLWAGSVSFTECSMMKRKINDFIASDKCTVETAWKHGVAILAAATSSSGGVNDGVTRKVISDTMAGSASKQKSKQANGAKRKLISDTTGSASKQKSKRGKKQTTRN